MEGLRPELLTEPEEEKRVEERRLDRPAPPEGKGEQACPGVLGELQGFVATGHRVGV